MSAPRPGASTPGTGDARAEWVTRTLQTAAAGNEVGITSARGGSRGLPPAHLCTSVTCGIVVASWWRAHECIPGGQGVAGSNPAVPTVFRTLVPRNGNEVSRDRSHPTRPG